MIVDRPSNREYKELLYIGQLNPALRKRAIPKGPTLFCKPSLLYDISRDDWDDFHQYTGQYFYNIPSIESIDKAEMKIDEERPWPKMDSIRAFAQSIADRMLEVPLTAKEYTDKETLEDMFLDKGPSIPWKFMGHKTRKSVYESKLWLDNFEDVEFLKELLPLYESVGKEELASVADFDNKKVRTFQTTSAHLLYWQKRLFGRGNENLKNYMWSKYGFNPFYGGTDLWYKELNQKDEDGELIYPVRRNWDIEGYDRKVFLEYVADRRYKCWKRANPNSKYDAIAKYVCDALKRSVLVFHNGDVVIRKRGNNSGSGSTTANNIEAGFEVVADLLIYVYFKKYGEFPEPDIVIRQLVSLFGDDNAMYLMKHFELLLDDVLVKDRLLQQHGLKCKWLVGSIEHPFNELPFLGFTFHEYKGYAIPKWNLQRIMHPILYTPTSKTPGQYLQQFYALLVMSFAHEEVFHKLRDLYFYVLQTIGSGSGNAEVKTMVRLGVPTVEEVESFYIGFENKNDSRIFDIVTGGGGPLFKMMESVTKYTPITFCPPRLVSDRNDREQTPLRVSRNTIQPPVLLPAPYLLQDDDWSDLLVSPETQIQPLVDIEDLKRINAEDKYKNYHRYCESCQRYGACCMYHGDETVLRDQLYRDNRTKARIAGMPRPGTFNVYGNEMLATPFVQFFQPFFRTNPSGGFECYSTIMFNDRSPVACIGSGSNMPDAFNDWYSNATTYITAWEPETRWTKFYSLLRTLPKPPDGHPLSYMWKDDYTLHQFDLLKLCGDIEENPGPLGKQEYLKQYKLQFDRQKLTPAQRNQRFKNYLENGARFNIGNGPRQPRGQMTTTRRPQNNQIVATKKQRNKINNSQIGAKKMPTVRPYQDGRNIARSIMDVSECSREYFAALTCPFYWVDDACNGNVRGLGLNTSDKKMPCIPLPPNLKSRKAYFFIRGTFGVSSPTGATPNSANIMFAPRRLANNNNADQFSPPIIIQGTGFTTGLDGLISTTLDTPAALGPGMSTANFNSEYTAAELVLFNTRGIRYRVVGAGLRIQYTGSEVNLAGTVHSFVQPNHDTVAGLSVTASGQYETYFKTAVSKDWVVLTHTPVVEDDFNYLPDYPSNPTAYAGSVFALDSQQHYMAMTITDCPAGTFNYEAIVLMEMTGQLVRGLTPTVVDSSGVSAVLNGATTAMAPQLNKMKDFTPLLDAGVDLVSAFVPEAKALKMATPMGNKILNMLS